MVFILPGGLGQVGGVAGASVFDPANTTTPYAALSNNNATLSATASTLSATTQQGASRGVKSRGSGRWYFEMTATAVNSGSISFGVCAAAFNTAPGVSNASMIGYDLAGNSMGYILQSAGVYYASTQVLSQVMVNAGGYIGVALDNTTGPYPGLLFYANGTGGGSTQLMTNLAVGTALYPAASVGARDTVSLFDVAAINTVAPFKIGTIPSGYTAWG